MLSVRLSEEKLVPLLTADLSIAAVNSPQLCVVSGPTAAIESMMKICAEKDIVCRKLHTSHAFHSAMMEPAIGEFRTLVKKITLSPPVLPIISTVSGKQLTDQQATDPEYWSRHMRVTVRFSAAIAAVLSTSKDVNFIEVGPRATCSTLVRQQPHDFSNCCTVASLGDGNDWRAEGREVLAAMGQLWQTGVEPDWDAYYRDEKRMIVPLPSYPFEKKRYWIDAPDSTNTKDKSTKLANEAEEKTDVRESLESSSNTVVNTVLTMVAEALGGSPDTLNKNATFMQLGMDSLFLTQMTQRAKVLFNVTITMRQLMREHNTITKLSDFITVQKSNG